MRDCLRFEEMTVFFLPCGKQRSSSKHSCSFPESIIFAEFIANLGAVKTSQMQSNNNADDMLLG